MYYKINQRYNQDMEHLIGKLLLASISLLVGVCLGLYLAAMTVPLPPKDTVIYIGGR